MKLGLEVVAYGGSLLSIWLAGRKSIYAPLVSIWGFIPWSILAWIADVPLMIAFNAVVTGLYTRNLILWSQSSDTPMPNFLRRWATRLAVRGRSSQAPTRT